MILETTVVYTRVMPGGFVAPDEHGTTISFTFLFRENDSGVMCPRAKVME